MKNKFIQIISPSSDEVVALDNNGRIFSLTSFKVGWQLLPAHPLNGPNGEDFSVEEVFGPEPNGGASNDVPKG